MWNKTKRNLLTLSRARLPIAHKASIAKQALSTSTVGCCSSHMEWNFQERNRELYRCLLWITVYTLHHYYVEHPAPTAPYEIFPKPQLQATEHTEIISSPSRTLWKWVNDIVVIYLKLLWETKAKNPTTCSMIGTKINCPGNHERARLEPTLSFLENVVISSPSS